MKKYFSVIAAIGFIFSLVSCTTQPVENTSQDIVTAPTDEEVETETPIATKEIVPTATETEKLWQASSPIAEFTDEDIEYLGIECSGSDLEIAQCIKEWEENNILFCVSPSGEDLTLTCSALVETNEILPGILTSKDVIYNQLFDGQINGLCLDYAATYCSIAEYYGLECRIVRSDTKFCEEVKCDPDEVEPSYDQLTFNFFIKPILDRNNLPFSLEAINSVTEDTWAHYWAEVLIDGEWEFMDASARDTAQRYAGNGVVVVDWSEMDKSDEMIAFMNQ